MEEGWVIDRFFCRGGGEGRRGGRGFLVGGGPAIVGRRLQEDAFETRAPDLKSPSQHFPPPRLILHRPRRLEKLQTSLPSTDMPAYAQQACEKNRATLEVGMDFLAVQAEFEGVEEEDGFENCKMPSWLQDKRR